MTNFIDIEGNILKVYGYRRARLKQAFCSIPVDYKLIQILAKEHNIRLDNHICFITDNDNTSYMWSDGNLSIGKGIVEEAW